MSGEKGDQAVSADIAGSPECFVIMPISDPEGYENGHFKTVYESIFKPACAKADFHAVRADEVLEANIIHWDIVRRIIESPMALCDLST